MSEYVSLTIHRCEDDPGVVIGNNICIAVLWLVDLQVGVLPGELLSWINRLTDTERREVYREMGWSESSVCISVCGLSSSDNRVKSPDQKKKSPTNKFVIPPTAL